jgi:hypothetical protein
MAHGGLPLTAFKHLPHTQQLPTHFNNSFPITTSLFTHTLQYTLKMPIPILIIGSAVLTGVDMVREHKAKKRALRAREAGLHAPVVRTPATENATQQMYDEELPAYDEDGAPPYREAEERRASRMHKWRERK